MSIQENAFDNIACEGRPLCPGEDELKERDLSMICVTYSYGMDE